MTGEQECIHSENTEQMNIIHSVVAEKFWDFLSKEYPLNIKCKIQDLKLVPWNKIYFKIMSQKGQVTKAPWAQVCISPGFNIYIPHGDQGLIRR